MAGRVLVDTMRLHTNLFGNCSCRVLPKRKYKTRFKWENPIQKMTLSLHNWIEATYQGVGFKVRVRLTCMLFLVYMARKLQVLETQSHLNVTLNKPHISMPLSTFTLQ